MLKMCSNSVSRVIKGLLFSLLLPLLSAMPVHSAVAAGLCAQADPLEICVVSASITENAADSTSFEKSVFVYTTLRITNKSDFPVGAAFFVNRAGSWSLSPEHAPPLTNFLYPSIGRYTITSSNAPPDWTSSGIETCRRTEDCIFSTLSANATVVAQVQFMSVVQRSALQMLEIASEASLSGSMLVSERGTSRVVPIGTDSFPFTSSVSIN